MPLPIWGASREHRHGSAAPHQSWQPQERDFVHLDQMTGRARRAEIRHASTAAAGAPRRPRRARIRIRRRTESGPPGFPKHLGSGPAKRCPAGERRRAAPDRHRSGAAPRTAPAGAAPRRRPPVRRCRAARRPASEPAPLEPRGPPGREVWTAPATRLRPVAPEWSCRPAARPAGQPPALPEGSPTLPPADADGLLIAAAPSHAYSRFAHVSGRCTRTGTAPGARRRVVVPVRFRCDGATIATPGTHRGTRRWPNPPAPRAPATTRGL